MDMHDWEKSLTRVVGKRVVDVIGYVSYELGDPTFKITGILLEDGTILAVEGEHDFPYVAVELTCRSMTTRETVAGHSLATAMALVGMAVYLYACGLPASEPAYGKDPTGEYATAPFHDFFEHVMEPDHEHTSCCGEADAYYMLEYHESTRPDLAFEGWTAPIKKYGQVVEPQYVYIPKEKVNWDTANPTGRGVVWLLGPITDEGGVPAAGFKPTVVLCFVPGSGT